MTKICDRHNNKHEGWYNVGDNYYCPSCNGKIIDKEYINKIERANKIKWLGF